MRADRRNVCGYTHRRISATYRGSRRAVISRRLDSMSEWTGVNPIKHSQRTVAVQFIATVVSGSVPVIVKNSKTNWTLGLEVTEEDGLAN
jgi:hypothetical protein